jgi:hypothetical protein
MASPFYSIFSSCFRLKPVGQLDMNQVSFHLKTFYSMQIIESQD